MPFGSTLLLRAATCLLTAALALLLSPAAPAQSIDLSLNVFYNDPNNNASGGTWQLVGKSSGAGIASLSVRLANISAALQNIAPRGTVNGSDPAGFSFVEQIDFGTHRNVLIGQAPLNPNQLGIIEEQSIFYGVGTLQNGAPNWPGRPLGTNSIGPAFVSLTNVQNVPWATGDVFADPAWNTAAALVSGTFATGVTPGFFPGTTGQVFTTVGTNKIYGNIAEATISAIVRTNFTGTGLAGDYNQDGKVDAADYVLWRKNNGGNTALPNDGGLGVPISAAHYNLWRSNFGMMNGAGAGAGSLVIAVPEPSTAALVALCSAALLAARRRRRVCWSVLPERAGRGTRTEQGAARRAGPTSPARAGDKLLRKSNESRPAAAGREKRFFTGFSGAFEPLTKSRQKSKYRSGNCLTAPKTPNIMPDGGRAFPLARLLAAGMSGRSAGHTRRSSKLSAGLCGAELSGRRREQPSDCPRSLA